MQKNLRHKGWRGGNGAIILCKQGGGRLRNTEKPPQLSSERVSWSEAALSPERRESVRELFSASVKQDQTQPPEKRPLFSTDRDLVMRIASSQKLGVLTTTGTPGNGLLIAHNRTSWFPVPGEGSPLMCWKQQSPGAQHLLQDAP